MFEVYIPELDIVDTKWETYAEADKRGKDTGYEYQILELPST